MKLGILPLREPELYQYDLDLRDIALLSGEASMTRSSAQGGVRRPPGGAPTHAPWGDHRQP